MKKYIALVLLVGMGLSSCQVIDKVSNVMSNGLNMPVFDDNNGIGIFVGQNLEHLKECVEHDPEVVTTNVYFPIFRTDVSPLLLVFLESGTPREQAEYLLACGADPNFAYDETTLLMMFADSWRDDGTYFGELLVRYGADVNIKDDSGKSALYFAVKSGNSGYVKLLLENGAEVSQDVIDVMELSVSTFLKQDSSEEVAEDIPRWQYDTDAFYTIPALIYEAAEKQGGEARPADALLQAVLTGDSEAVIGGVGISVASSDVLSYLAAAYCNADVMAYLVSQGLDVSALPEDGMTLLWMAASSGNFDVVKYLIKNGASVNANDYKRQDRYSDFHPLKSSVENDCYEVAKYLLEQGFEIDIRYEKGNADESRAAGTILGLAAKNGNVDMMELLKEHQYPFDKNTCYTALLDAIAEDQIEAAAYLLENGADVNYRDDRFDESVWLPLEQCAAFGTAEMFDLLFDNGLVVSEEQSSSALRFAVDAHNIDNVIFLLEHGMPVDAEITYEDGSRGGAAMNGAIDYGYLDLVKLLTERGTDLNDINYVYLIFTAGPSWHITEYLLQQGADADIRSDYDGRTALMMAASWNNTDSIKLLLDAGADKTLKDSDGLTAYDYAKENDAKDAMKLLR